MGERIVKFRLVTYFDEVENQVTPQGDNVLVERTASMGDRVHLRSADEKRLDSLGALYSKDEAKKIEAGTYSGPDAALLRQFMGSGPAAPQPTIDGEGPQIDGLSADELADYILENKLNVDDTVGLAGEGDADLINKVYDAEIAAAQKKGADPRKGVTDRLDALLNAATSGD